MRVKLQNYLKSNGIIILILIVSAILRLLYPTEIPFTHDEFSALFRTEFKSFHDLIQFGVMPDGHPALIQVFLFYWVKIFGFNELGVKFPFVLFGIASVYLIYLLAKKWYNQTVALISASFAASLQYTVIYSQIARPYISGLFFSLLMVWFWTNLIQNPQSKSWKNSLLYILFSSLCAYNHYFSLFFAFLVGITGLFLIDKKYLVKYVFSGLLIILLFTPHLGILFHQLQTGSVEEWLGKPKIGFFTDYLAYFFHFSYFVGSLVIGIIIIGIFKRNESSNWKNKHFIISICWFLAPIFIGFVYSYAVGAVLQFSVLIFTFPFLLFILFGHIPQLKLKYNILIIMIIMIVNVTSLIFERKHYSLFYRSPYEQILIETQNAQNEYGNNCISIVSSHPKITKFYLNKDNLNCSFINLDNFEKTTDFIKFIQTQKAEYLSFGCLSNIDPLEINLILEYYPKLEKKIDYVGGNFYVFSKHGISSESLVLKTEINGFDPIFKNWENAQIQYYTDSISHSGKYSYFMNKNQEFGPAFFGDLFRFVQHHNDFIDVSVSIHSNQNLKDVFIVSSIQSKDNILDWRATNVNDFMLNDPTLKWQKAFHSIKLSDVNLTGKDIKLKIFLWNRSHEEFYTDDLQITGRLGNPVIYGLVQKTK